MVSRGVRGAWPAAVAVVLSCAAAAPARAAGGPSGSGDASSAQYAPFLGGQGRPLKGPYAPPTLSRSSPSSLDLLLVGPEAAAVLALGAAGLLVRGRTASSRGANRFHTGDP